MEDDPKVLIYESLIEKMGVIWTVTGLARFLQLAAVDFLLKCSFYF
jgi:hypothetical protein